MGINLLFIYHISAYCDKGPFEEDAELCECTCGKAVFLKGSCVLQIRKGSNSIKKTGLLMFTNTVNSGTNAFAPVMCAI